MLSWVDTAAKGFRPVGIIALLSFVPQAFIAAINLVPEYDESIYLDISENLYRMGLPIVSYESGIFFFQHPPLSFLFFSLPFVANLDYLVAYRAVSSVFAVGTVFLTFLLGRLVGGRRIAILAAALLAFTPLFLAYSHSVYMDVILGFFLLLSAYFFLKADEQGKGVFWLLSGISLGLALWVKYLAAIAVLAYLAHLFMRYRWSVARRRETYVLLGPALGLFLLWPVYGLALDHQQFISELVRWSTFGGNNLHDARVGVSLPEYGLRFLRSISPPIVVLLVFAMVRKLLVAGRRPAKLQTFFPHWYLVIWILFLALVMPIKDMRYLIPAIPWIGLAVASDVDAVAGWLERRGPNNLRILYAALAVFVATAYVPYLGQVPMAGKLYRPSPLVKRLSPEENAFRQVGEYVAEHTARDEIITVNQRGPQFGYLADRRYRILDFETYSEVTGALERSRVVVQDGLWRLPYLDATQKEEFLSRLARDFQVGRTFNLGRDEYTTRVFFRKPPE